MYAFDRAPEAGCYGRCEFFCLFDSGIFIRPVRVKYLHEHGKIIVFDCCSVLSVHAALKLSHAYPDSSSIDTQHACNRVRQRLSRVGGQLARG